MSTTQSRIFDILWLLRRSSTPISLTDIAKQLKVAPSSVHSGLATLVKHGAATIDSDKRYQLGPAVFYLGSVYARNAPVYRAAWPDLVRAAGELKLSAAVAVPWENHHLVLAVHQFPGARLGVAVGSRIPFDAGSYGKAYYAWSGANLPKKITRFTDRTIVDLAAYGREVALTRRRGFATDTEEFVADVSAVAVGITSSGGYEGLCALMGSAAQLKEVGIDAAGKMIAAVGERASTLLGDLSREAL